MRVCHATPACVTYSWHTLAFSECSLDCDTELQEKVRVVRCMGSDGSIVADTLCEGVNKPLKPAETKICSAALACITCSGPPGAFKRSSFAFFVVNRFCTGPSYGRTGSPNRPKLRFLGRADEWFALDFGVCPRVCGFEETTVIRPVVCYGSDGQVAAGALHSCSRLGVWHLLIATALCTR